MTAPLPLRTGPQQLCPSCTSGLDGGPVVFWCPRCRCGMHAADLDEGYRPRAPTVR
jgi:hypothetical protein